MVGESAASIAREYYERQFFDPAGWSNRQLNATELMTWGELDDRYRNCGQIVMDNGTTWNRYTQGYLPRYGEQMMFQARPWYQSVYIEHYWGTRSEHDTIEDSDEEEEESDGMDTE